MSVPSSKATDLARDLVATLPVGAANLFSPWHDVCPEDLVTNGPTEKLVRLAHHVDCNPRLLVVGEAPGYQGCRHSGLPFTSEAQLLDGTIPRIPPVVRLTHRPRPYKELSATVMWRTLHKLKLAEQAIVWNALQMHPHRPGEPNSNRTPKATELAHGAAALRILTNAFPDAPIVAVGRKAGVLLGLMGFTATAVIRHPANGGVGAFEAGMADLAPRIPAKVSAD